MTDSRAEILDRIRRGLGRRPGSREGDYQTIPRTYVKVGTLGLSERIAMFEHRLDDYDAVVHRCAETDLRQLIGQVLGDRGKRRIVIPSGLPRNWVPDGPEIIVDEHLEYSDLDRADAVLTGCTVCIALTGTIILTHSAAEGRRALTLIPDYHLCVVREDQVVETVAEGLREARRSNPDVLTTISGPSATADIEMTRIKGVHGPRTLEVILVSGL